MDQRADILAAVAGLERTVNRSGDRRAPHKPLLFLVALARLRQGSGTLTFAEVEDLLRPLLERFAPPGKGAPASQLPYWHLQSDGLWVVDGAEALPRSQSGFPQLGGLRASSGHMPVEVARRLLADPTLAREAVERVLQDHFPESMHEDILDAVGLDLDDLGAPARAADSAAARDPAFRQAVLRAYDHRCAVTGFHVQLRGAHLGLDSAHVRWHSHGGPDLVSNGLALQSTLHKLLDAGAWSLTDDRRILVSQDLTGGDQDLAGLRKLHGAPIRDPLRGFPAVSPAFIRWHREPAHGGIFRQPAMPL
jgi:putative restriction endonuclease